MRVVLLRRQSNSNTCRSFDHLSDRPLQGPDAFLSAANEIRSVGIGDDVHPVSRSATTKCWNWLSGLQVRRGLVVSVWRYLDVPWHALVP